MENSKVIYINGLVVKSVVWLDILQETEGLKDLVLRQIECFAPCAITYPLECDQLGSLMEKLASFASSRYVYLRQCVDLPVELGVEMFFIANDLQLIQKQAAVLIDLSATFRAICLDNTDDKLELSRKIRDELSGILKLLRRFIVRIGPINEYYREKTISQMN